MPKHILAFPHFAGGFAPGAEVPADFAATHPGWTVEVEDEPAAAPRQRRTRAATQASTEETTEAPSAPHDAAEAVSAAPAE
jgi:hypothetical protein